ncbi:MAG: 23S rRNA (adenine(2503)-C(2))-methyltransferase RlmN [Deltaproteobacteria bacterium]|nr:23S rRNA (adenine(2503)-C(2))-methyltransferase RlmN [Deltaproteobacteria bacterium]
MEYLSTDPGKPNLRGVAYETLAQWLDDRGEKPYRQKQIFAWVHRPAGPIASFDEMTDIKKGLREALAEGFDLSLPEIAERQVSPDGTRKYLFVSPDGGAYEAVYIPEVAIGSNTNTLCVSSQTGCSVGCTFCFTASLRRNRNLTTAEIMGQVHAVMRDVKELGDQAKVTNIVFMGMGEPLLNYDNVVAACRLMVDERGLWFATRRVTVSTSGIVPNIARLGQDTEVQLALSLHAASDDIRSKIVPINKKWGVGALVQALRDYPLKPRRRFTIEYVVLGGVNDSLEEAHKTGRLLQGIPCKINLLPLNPHERTPHAAPSEAQTKAFQAVLREYGFNVFIRTPRGQEISAACGQLGGLAEEHKLSRLPIVNQEESQYA